MRNSLLAAIVAALILSTPAFAFRTGELTEWWTNWASAEEGATISSPCKLHGGSELEGIIGKKDRNGDIGCVFADRTPQREEFTIDFGQTRKLGRIIFQCELQRRTPKRLLIEVSNESAQGPWKTIFETDHVMQNHTFGIDDELPARWMHVDFGERTDGIGSRIRVLKVCPRYHLKSATALIQEFHKEFRRDVAELAAFWKAIDEKRWEAACDELIKLYASRGESIRQEFKGTKPSERAQGFFENRVVDAGNTYQFDSSDWNWHALEPGAPGPSLGLLPGAYSIFNDLTNGYLATGEEKRARKLMEVVTDWLQDNPYPGWHADQNGDLIEGWTGLTASGRSGVLNKMVRSLCGDEKFITRDFKINLIYALWQHATLLDAIRTEVGGNWLTNVNSGLFGVALDYPEFVQQKTWIEHSMESFERSLSKDVYPCGREVEDSTMYVPIASGHLIGQYAGIRKAGLKLSDEAERKMSVLWDASAWMGYPNGAGPAIGDCGRRSPLKPGGDFAPQEFLDLFDRPDLVYMNSRGKEGKMPRETSREFAGWYVMRSAWDEKPYEDARQMFFKCTQNRTHGHRDQLEVTLYAYGREILTDPGMAAYGTREGAIASSTPWHNTLCVNESDQDDKAGEQHAWAAGKGADFADASFHYGTVINHRQIIFLKSGKGLPDYWLVSDRLNGRSVEHTFDVNWHFSEDAKPVIEGKSARSTYASGGNVLIYGAGDLAAPTITDYWIADFTRGQAPAKCVRYRLKSLPWVRFDTLLVPCKGAKPPQFGAANMKPDGQDTDRAVSALKVETAGGTDIVFVSAEPGRKASFEGGKLITDAHALALRFDKAGKLVYAFQCGGSESAWNGKSVIKLKQGENFAEL